MINFNTIYKNKHKIKQNNTKSYLVFLCLIITFVLFSNRNLLSQTENVGIGTITPDNSAVLHITFSNPANPKGLLIPKLTTVERNSITNPATGLLIFNTTTNAFEYNSGIPATPVWAAIFASGNLTLANGSIYIGNVSGQAIGVTPTGDVLITNAGLTTIQPNAVTTGKILDGTILAADLADGAVTTTQILDGTIATIDLADNSVTGAKIPIDAVNGTKLSLTGEAAGSMMYFNGTDWVNLGVGTNNQQLKITTGVPAWATDNSLSTTLASGQIFLGNVSNVATAVTPTGDVTITNAGVATIANNVVTTGKILDGTILAADMADGSVTTGKLADAGITEIKIGNQQVTVDKIATNSIIEAKIQDGAITSVKISDGTIVNADISATAEIVVTKLGNGTNDQLIRTNGTNVEWFTPTFATTSSAVGGDLSGTIADAQIIANAVTSAEIADNAVGNSELTDNAVNTAELTDVAVTANKIANDAVTTNKILNLNVTSAKIADDAVTSAKIANAAVLRINIVDDAINTAKIADDAVTNAKLAGSINPNKITVADTQIFVGNASNQAASVALSGDATIINTGALTVSAIQGIAVSTTDPTANQVLAYNSTNSRWEPKHLGIERKSRVRAFLNTNQLVADATETKIIFNSEDFDTNTEFNTTTGIFTAKITGYYQVNSRIRFDLISIASGSNRYGLIAIYKNGVLNTYGTRMALSTTALTPFNLRNDGYVVSDIVFLNVDDTLEIRGYQNSATARNAVSGSAESYVSIHLLSE